jgi:catechol 2,3-dioxygenase-like lactoylglutathione lyase family enzyme
MAIVGIKSLRYGVDDVARSTKFFADFGLPLAETSDLRSLFALPDGSNVEIVPLSAPALPEGGIVGTGVRELVWGIDTEASLASLSEKLSRGLSVKIDKTGRHHFLTPFGVPMALEHFPKKKVINAPDPLNAPDHIGRLNTHRKWRIRARPKVINHAVFKVADFGAATIFMRESLGFRLSDIQEGFGSYLRADGSNNHHNILFLNANAHFPGCDGQTRFDHANFGVEDIDELMIGANYMSRQGWGNSTIGLGRHRVDSALFYYLPSPAGGEVEYGADADYVDDGWVPRRFSIPLFAYAHFTHNIPDFLRELPEWQFTYLTHEAG